MKKITLNYKEFHLFKQRANEIKLWFDYKITKGIVFITADETLLERLGY